MTLRDKQKQMMNIMKNIVRYMIPAAAFLAICSCSKEEPVAMDRDDCYDVYFDGGQSKVYELDQSEEASVTFTSLGSAGRSTRATLVVRAGLFATNE